LVSTQQGAARVADDRPSLKLKFGAVGRIEPAMIAKAEAALARMTEFFGPWLGEEIEQLAAARSDIRDLGYTPETAEALNIRAHELKSMGSTFGFPVITDIAGCLCRLVEEPETRMAAPLYLIDAHIDAIGAAARDNVHDSNHPVGAALVWALNERVQTYLNSAAMATTSEIRRNTNHS
jgi:hypothetical protein